MTHRQEIMFLRQELDKDDFAVELPYEVAAGILEQLLNAEERSTHVLCKDCANRGEDECPMRHVELYYHHGWEEWDDIVYDRTEDDGYCHKGEKGDFDDLSYT